MRTTRNLSKANLTDANLSKANLTNANLRGTNLQGAALQGAAMRSPETRLDGVTGAPVRSASGIQHGSRVLVLLAGRGGVQTGTIADARYLHDGSHISAKVKWDHNGVTSKYIKGPNMVLLA